MGKKSYPTTTPDWGAAVKRRTRFYTLMAAILAILFGILLYSSLDHQNQFAPGDYVTAVFAAQDIPSGIVIKEDMLEEKKVPGQILSTSGSLYQEQIIGKEVIFPLIEGEMILLGKLVGDRGGPISGRCPSGKWCVSVPSSWFIAPPPDLVEGDRIEIASTLPGDDPDQTGIVVSGGQIIFQTIQSGNLIYVIAVEDLEAISLLYAAANQFQLFALVRPAGGD